MTVANVTPPVISGTTVQGNALHSTPGTWTSDAILSYIYQWERCDGAGANCVDISNATASSYILTSADVGHTLRVRVTATEAPYEYAPSSIDATGSSEVASDLETWLNGLADGATAVLPTNGTYLCNRVRTGGTPALSLTKSLTILGRGCTITQDQDPGDTSDLPIIKWTSVSNVTVRDLNIVGARPTNADYNDPWQHGHGFSIWGCSSFLFDNVSVRNVYGDGMYFAGSSGAGGTQSQNCTVQNSTFRHTGRMGIACVHAKFVLVDNCTFTDPGLSIFDVEPNVTTGTCTDLTFQNSTATNTTENASVHLHCLLFIANHENGGQPVERVTLDNNVTVTGAGAVALPRKIFCAPCWNGDFPIPTCDRGNEPRYSDITITNNTSATGSGNETYAHITNLVRSGNSANTTVLTEDVNSGPAPSATWWSAASPVNTKIPNNPTVVRNYGISISGGGIGFNGGAWGCAFFEDSSQFGSRRTISTKDNSWHMDNVPIPGGWVNYFTAFADPEKHHVVADGDHVYNIYSMNSSYTGPSGGMGMFRSKTASSGFWDNSLGPWCGRASGFASALGVIRKAEFNAGLIPHALSCCLDKEQVGGPSNFVSPASSSDGLGTISPVIPMGSRFQLDPTLTDAQLTALGIGSNYLCVCHAMQDYGIFVGDSSSWMALYAESWNDSTGKQTWPSGWGNSANLIPHLRIVAPPADPVWDDRTVFNQPHH